MLFSEKSKYIPGIEQHIQSRVLTAALWENSKQKLNSILRSVYDRTRTTNTNTDSTGVGVLILQKVLVICS